MTRPCVFLFFSLSCIIQETHPAVLVNGGWQSQGPGTVQRCTSIRLSWWDLVFRRIPRGEPRFVPVPVPENIRILNAWRERERPALLSFRSWPRVLEGVSKVCRAKERRSLSFSSSSFFSLNKYPRFEKKVGEKSTIKTIRTFVPSKGTISLSSRGIPFRREDVCRKPPRFNPKNGTQQKRGKSLLRPNWNDRDVNGGDAQRRP